MRTLNGGTHIVTPVFDGASEEQVKDYLEKQGYPRAGKVDLYDGRTGENLIIKLLLESCICLNFTTLLKIKCTLEQ